MTSHEIVDAFLRAFAARDYAAVGELAAAGASIDTHDDDGWTALMRAVMLDDATVASVMLDAGASPEVRCRRPVEQDDTDDAELLAQLGMTVAATPSDEAPEGGATPVLRASTASRASTALMIAAEAGRVATVEVLLEHGADAEAEDRQGDTALTHAIIAGRSEVVERLVAAVDVDARLGGGATALETAIKAGQTDVVRTLLAAGARVDTDASGLGLETPLYHAVSGGRGEIVDIFLAAGAKANAMMLRQAVSRGHAEITRRLLESGVAPESTLLLDAIEAGHADIARTLVAHGANLDRSGLSQRTPLAAALEGGFPDLALAILAAGADPEAVAEASKPVLMRHDAGRPPLHLAAMTGALDMVEALLERGVDIDRQIDVRDVVPGIDELLTERSEAGDPIELHEEGATALMLAAGAGHLSIAERLLAEGANAALLDARGDSALFRAVRAGHDPIATLLQASNDGDDGFAESRLVGAVDDGEIGAVRAALADGADPCSVVREEPSPDAPKGDDVPVLVLASRLGFADAVTALLEEGADPDQPSRPSGRTALFAAAAAGHLGVVERLLAAGAAVDEVGRTADGHRTALMMAAIGDHGAIVTRLAEAGAELGRVDEDGRSALALAREHEAETATQHLAWVGAALEVEEASTAVIDLDEDAPAGDQQESGDDVSWWVGADTADEARSR
ncbi:MAG: ankyrin repeat domain-containing protein [Acidobacteriota bacterium]